MTETARFVDVVESFERRELKRKREVAALCAVRDAARVCAAAYKSGVHILSRDLESMIALRAALKDYDEIVSNGIPDQGESCSTCQGWGIYKWSDGEVLVLDASEARRARTMFGMPWKSCPECGASPYKGPDGCPIDAPPRGL